MKKGDLVKCGEDIYRVLAISEDGKILVVDCKKKAMPTWIDLEGLEDTNEDIMSSFTITDELSSKQLAEAHRRLSWIGGILPYIEDNKRRSEALNRASEFFGIGKQTLRKYLWLYLVYQDVKALAPVDRKSKGIRELTPDEKKMRWGLNKFYYTKHKNSLKDAYIMLLKEKYTDAEGNLLSVHPSFYQFRYFYRRTKSFRTQSISRDGIKAYERNERPLLGDGMQEFAGCVGYGMMDATVCDIYLINNAGGIVGRPILTACVDAFSGLCIGYSLSWEGGVYSLTDLMMNVITDKEELCRIHGIDSRGWKCSEIPSALITDMGREYISANFEQITELGVTIVNLPSYRPDLKGPIEQFFNVIQELYKPYLKGKGVIEPDFQERGAHDYRKDACITMETFEKVILECIIHYNTQRIVNFPFTEQMLNDGVRPYSQTIYDWSKANQDCSLIQVTKEKLALTLLPRCKGKFNRKGLIVNKMRYQCEGHDEDYLRGGDAVVAYNPDDSGFVWLKTDKGFEQFTLIESRYKDKTLSEVSEMMDKQKSALKSEQETALQADVILAKRLELLATLEVMPMQKKRTTNRIKDIRANRDKEKTKTHKNHLKEVGAYD